MAFGPSVTATYGADTKPLQEKTGEAVGLVEQFTDQVKSLSAKAAGALGEVGAGLLKGFIITDAAAKILGFLTDIKEKVINLTNLSRELGVGTDALQLFEKAVVRAGGSSESAQKIWEKARKSLSDLNEGTPTATAAFEKLGLSAKDFVGLNFEQALEKIAQGYVKNRDQAGAYSAMLEILGTRTVPQATAAIVDLGTRGFGGLEANTNSFFGKIDSGAIEAMDTVIRSFSKGASVIKNVVANIAGGFLEALAFVGKQAAVITNLVTGVDNDWDAVLSTTKKVVAVTEQQKVATDDVKQSASELRVQLDEQSTTRQKLLQFQLAELTGEERLNALAVDYLALQKASNNQLLTTGERKAALAEMDKVGLELTKETNTFLKAQFAELDKQVAAGAKIFAQWEAINRAKKLDALPPEERLNELYKERSLILADQGKYAKGSVEWTADAIKLNTKDNEIADAKLVILKKQTDELEKQTKKVKDQAAAVVSLTDAFNGYQIAVKRTGNSYESQTTTALQGVRDRLNAQLSQVDAMGFTYRDAPQRSDIGGYITGTAFKAELAAVMKELDLRKQISDYASRYGAEAATYQFGDSLTQRALSDLSSTQNRTATAAEALVKKFANL